MAKKKSFLDELHAHKQKSQSKRRGVVAVLAHKQDITDGLNAGFTLKDIYTVLSDKGKMPVAYSGFVKLVRKYIHPKEEQVTPKQDQTETSKRKPGVFDPTKVDVDDLVG